MNILSTDHNHSDKKNNFAKNCQFLWANKLSHFALRNSNKTQLIYITYLTVLQKMISRFSQIHCFFV